LALKSWTWKPGIREPINGLPSLIAGVLEKRFCNLAFGRARSARPLITVGPLVSGLYSQRVGARPRVAHCAPIPVTFGARPAQHSSPRRKPVSLGAPQQEIIDSCLREVMKGKFPALGHKMLAVLGGALRLDLILTTNFDDLLERAFAEARNPLEVFEVHLGSPLLIGRPFLTCER